MGRRPNNGPSFSGGNFIGNYGASNRDYFQQAFSGLPRPYAKGKLLPIEALFPKKKAKKTAKELTAERLKRTERLLAEISASNARKKSKASTAKRRQGKKSTASPSNALDREKVRREPNTGSGRTFGRV